MVVGSKYYSSRVNENETEEVQGKSMMLKYVVVCRVKFEKDKIKNYGRSKSNIKYNFNGLTMFD